MGFLFYKYDLYGISEIRGLIAAEEDLFRICLKRYPMFVISSAI